MTGSRAPAEPETTAFEAAVVEAGRSLVLEETYFYPAGGGQPADRGLLAGVPVEDVRTEDGRVVHHLATDPGVEVGATVAGRVDEAFRTYCARAHTASHALYGAGRRLFDEIGYGGFDITEEKVRVDLAVDGIDADALAELERLTNRAVWDSRPVSWERLPREDAFDREGVAFNTQTEEGIDADAVRLVTIEDWDVAACGGTHVRNTREIGPVTVLDRSNPGEGLTRVEFAVGPPAIRRRAAERRAASAAARALDAGLTDIGEAAAALRDRVDALEADLAAAREALLAARLEDAERVEGTGTDGGPAAWLVAAVEGFEAGDVGDAARDRLADGDADAVAVAGGEGRTFVVVAADGDRVDAGAAVERATGRFGGGGGGGPTFAQGGGLDASPRAVLDSVAGR